MFRYFLSFRLIAHLLLLFLGGALISPGHAGWPKDLMHHIGQLASAGQAGVTVPAEGKTEIAFSPNEGAEQLVVKVIDSAKSEIRMLTYSFTSRPIAQALLRAKKRGVDVKVVVDHKNNLQEDRTGKSRAVLDTLVNAGIEVKTISVYAIHHDKVIIVDQKTLQTGSMNYSSSGESRNSENVIVLWDARQAAQAYLTHFNRNYNQAAAYAQRY
jgi:phosphatidylserine/phosphatidylglycerophosphate/cardiolipin synthase-like enzyme